MKIRLLITREAVKNLFTEPRKLIRCVLIFGKAGKFPFLQRLGMTFAPGKKQTGAHSGNWRRDLGSDLDRLVEYYHTDTLVLLIEDSEPDELGIKKLPVECRVRGIELIRFAVKDVSVPDSVKEFAVLIRKIFARLEQGKTVVIHCKGGFGRAGLTAACTVAAATEGVIGAEDAVKMVCSARPGTVETREQENFVSRFSEYWKSYKDETENDSLS